MALTDSSVISFGMHKGKTLDMVPANYLLWLLDEGKAFGELKDYIKDNEDVLRKEVKENRTTVS